MTLSKSHLWLLSALVVGGVLVAWLLLRHQPRENFVIETVIQPEARVITRVETNTMPARVPDNGNQRVNIPDGYGVFTHPDGSIYVGNFMDGRPQGQGKITFTGGASYEGEFHDGLPDGKGVCTYSNGESIDCVFAMGERQ